MRPCGFGKTPWFHVKWGYASPNLDRRKIKAVNQFDINLRSIDNVIMVSWGGFDETLYLNVDKGYGNQTLVLETLRNTRKN